MRAPSESLPGFTAGKAADQAAAPARSASAAIEVLYVHGHWRGVNDLEDLLRAGDFAQAQTPFGNMPGSSANPTDD
jgi:hypothetical protein